MRAVRTESGRRAISLVSQGCKGDLVVAKQNLNAQSTSLLQKSSTSNPSPPSTPSAHPHPSATTTPPSPGGSWEYPGGRFILASRPVGLDISAWYAWISAESDAEGMGGRARWMSNGQVVVSDTSVGDVGSGNASKRPGGINLPS